MLRPSCESLFTGNITKSSQRQGKVGWDGGCRKSEKKTNKFREKAEEQSRETHEKKIRETEPRSDREKIAEDREGCIPVRSFPGSLWQPANHKPICTGFLNNHCVSDPASVYPGVYYRAQHIALSVYDKGEVGGWLGLENKRGEKT